MERNLTMLTDLYQLTMMNGYLKYGMDKNVAVFDMFFRPLQNNSVYAGYGWSGAGDRIYK